MQMDNVIDNTNLSNNMKDIYKFIEKHKRDIDDVLHAIYKDLSGMFQNITHNADSIAIVTSEDICDTTKNIIDNSINSNTNRLLGTNNGDLSSYIFEVYYNNKYIMIVKKY